MTLRDFKSGGMDIISMIKGTDRFYDIYLKEDSGSVFQWDTYEITAEGRYSTLTDEPDFIFDVSEVDIDGLRYGRMVIPSIQITDAIRESKVHFKVKATKDGQTRVICRGEIWILS